LFIASQEIWSKKGWLMADRHAAVRYERSKDALRTYIMNEVAGIDDPKEARIHAKDSVDSYRDQKGAELEQAAKRFNIFQRIEFVIGALFLIQVAVFMLKGEPRLVILIYTGVATALLYVIAAVLDSKAKGKKLEINSQIQAAKKVKLKNDESGVVIEFE
jgi:VIT1/CCC1 family predicted Fe2+/Mn2+ transporter